MVEITMVSVFWTEVNTTKPDCKKRKLGATQITYVHTCISYVYKTYGRVCSIVNAYQMTNETQPCITETT